MAYEKKPTSLNSYRPTGNTTPDDLLKITFENGQAIFVHHRGFKEYTKKPKWVIHEDFCPSSILALRTPGRDHSEDIEGQMFNVPLEITAVVGEPATISIWQRSDDKSMFNVVSIEPSTYRSAYHDDLLLAQLINA